MKNKEGVNRKRDCKKRRENEREWGGKEEETKRNREKGYTVKERV